MIRDREPSQRSKPLDARACVREKVHQGNFYEERKHVSAVERLARPRRIKVAHRRRWKCSTGHSLYANDNPYRFTDPDGEQNQDGTVGGEDDSHYPPMCSTGSLTPGGCGAVNVSVTAVDNSYRRGSESSASGQRHPITSNERSMQSQGDLKGFWESRKSDGAPIATTALSIWAPEDVSPADRLKGELVLARLDAALIAKDGFANAMVLSIQTAYIGKDIAGGYIRTVDFNHGYEPTLSQFNRIHYDVFRSHGLSSSVYGGTPLGYAPSGAWKAWGDAQSQVMNDAVNYCDGCNP